MGATPKGRTPGIRAFAGAFGIYLCLSVLFFGRNVVAHPADRVVGDAAADKTLYMWSLEWWPFALGRGRNPLDVDRAWAPHGFDFGLGTGGGGLGLLAAPLTSLLGPVPTYNMLILAAPALAAATGFALAQRVTGRFAPSLVGGYVFGFSSYELGRILGHLPLAFVALVPLVPYLVLLRRDGALSQRRFVVLLAGVLVVQFLILPQIFFTLVVMGAVTALAACVLFGRRAVRKTLGEAAAALAVALIVVSPILVYAVVSDASPPARSPFAGSADVLNYVVPTRRTWLRPPGAEAIAQHFTGSGAEHGAYLGLPLIALVVLGAVRRPISRGRWLLVVVLAAAVVLSLGTRIKVAGEVVGIGPWAALAPFPVVGSALPIRLTMYVALVAGLLVALALADRASIGRWLLAAAGIVATLPNLGLAQWSSEVPRPSFFAENRYQQDIPEGSTVLVLPYGPAGWSMLWQAEARFSFRLVGGHFGLRVTPTEERWRDVYEALGTGRVSPKRLRSFLTAHNVDIVVVAPGTSARARRAIDAAAGLQPAHSLDALVYRLHPRSVQTPRPDG
ncbi:MAG TPA: hypothetical protein VF073_02555 [Gaiella sp.]